MKQVTNLNDRTQFYSSDEMLAELKSKIKDGDCIINFAFTDYGGTFFDKVMIEYFTENFPDSIVSEGAIYYGKNAFLFGDIANEFINEYESYPLCFRDSEEYYMNKESEQEMNDFKTFLEDIEKYNGYLVKENALDYLSEHKGGYYNITTQGIDYSESELITFCEDAGIIEKIKEETAN